MNPNYPSGTTGSTIDTTTAGTTSSTSSDRLQSAAQNTYSEAKSAAKRTGTALREELRNLKQDLDDLLGRSDNLSDSELSQEHARLMSKFSSLRSAAKGMAAQANQQFSRMAGQANEQFSRSMEMTTEYVKDKPLQSVAVATGVGMLLGMLFKSR